MKDFLAGLGVIVFLFGVYMMVRLIPVPIPSALQFWGAFALMVGGTVIFCAADPFFDRV